MKLLERFGCFQYVVLRVYVPSIFFGDLMAWWLSWLERRPVTAEVVGSNPIQVAEMSNVHFKLKMWGLSSAGRASALQAEGHRFEPCRPHFSNQNLVFADMAQLAEQLICNQQVIGSSPIIGFYYMPEILVYNK